MATGKQCKITTIKLKEETKERLDHLKEFERESYDETIKKMLYILNNLRSNPSVAEGILRNIDLKVKRKHQVSEGIPQEKKENTVKFSQKVDQEKMSQNPNIRNKFMMSRKIIRK